MCVHAVSSGSVTVNADSSVQLLAEEAVPLDQLDISVSIMSASLLSHTDYISMPTNEGKVAVLCKVFSFFLIIVNTVSLVCQAG